MTLSARLLRRALELVVLTFAVTTTTFLLASLIPGDFFTALEANPAVSRDLVAELRRQYGLSDPLPLQYLHWLGRSLRLDLGFSLHYMRPVGEVVFQALAHTAWLGLPALALGVCAGILVGSVHALHHGRPLGHALDALSALALALPPILLGIAAMLLAASTGWFPVGGVASAQPVQSGLLAAVLDRAHHLLLPVLSLALPIFASIEKIQHAESRQSARELYFRSARARGLRRSRIFLNYLVRPALNPVLSTLGPMFGVMLSGSLVLEQMFAWPGLGRATYDALFNRDVFLLLGCVGAGSVLLVAGNLAADLLLYLLDPRTRESSVLESA